MALKALVFFLVSLFVVVSQVIISRFIFTCRGLCLTRCGKHSRLKRCMRACEACCKECRCVPTGTHSNYKTCPPCYHQKRTKDGKHKCP
ncbi:hypothetical protein MKW98_017903 [Papaver atlanticum]|uniref:Gibberellin regulated protein n=1 Tax=Papaver atlanticum TaxID=357466 RepID=A0AAD4TCC2_9MAGN|nr:hypothetical protein MKW98_017903 [Papaver atlanticum]